MARHDQQERLERLVRFAGPTGDFPFPDGSHALPGCSRSLDDSQHGARGIRGFCLPPGTGDRRRVERRPGVQRQRQRKSVKGHRHDPVQRTRKNR
ncbi:hypothetical protein D9M71_822650 [compost metagenome]